MKNNKYLKELGFEWYDLPGNYQKKLEYNKKYREEHREEMLAKKKEYTKVFNYFHDEYTGMLKDFLKRNMVFLQRNISFS